LIYFLVEVPIVLVNPDTRSRSDVAVAVA